MNQPLPHPFIRRLAELQTVASPQHRQILEVLIQDPVHGALWGIEEMASRTGTSVATVMRLSKQLGFSGFSDFRAALKETIEGRASGSTEPSGEGGLLVEVLQRDQQNGHLLLQGLSLETLERAADLLSRARTRLVAGRGAGGVMAELLSHHLTQAGLPCLVAGAMPLAHLATNLRADDVMVVLSTAPYSMEITDAAGYAQECGIPVLVFADQPGSPDARKADLTILVPSEGLQRSQSLATFASLANALGLLLASRDQAAAVQRRKAAEMISGAVYLGQGRR